MGTKHVRELALSLAVVMPLCGCVAAGLPLELAVAGGSEAVGFGGAAAIKSGNSAGGLFGGLFGGGRTVAPNAMLAFWQQPISGDPSVVANIEPGDAEAAQPAYASALLSHDAGKYSWNNSNTKHSGWIEAGAEYVDPGGSKCRDIKQAYSLNRAMTGRRFRYCRTEYTGDWAPVIGTGQSFTEQTSS